MAADGRKRRIGRREAIAVCGLLVGVASAALLSHAVVPRPQATVASI